MPTRRHQRLPRPPREEAAGDPPRDRGEQEGRDPLRTEDRQEHHVRARRALVGVHASPRSRPAHRAEQPHHQDCALEGAPPRRLEPRRRGRPPPCGVSAMLRVTSPPSITPRLEPLPHQLENTPIRDALRHELHQLLVVDASEVVPDVGVEHVVTAFGSALPQSLQRHRRAPLRTEPVRARKKIRLEHRLHHQLHRHLNDPVSDRRDPEWPFLSVRLRDVPSQGHSLRPR